jgi:hypothetical protein
MTTSGFSAISLYRNRSKSWSPSLAKYRLRALANLTASLFRTKQWKASWGSQFAERLALFFPCFHL